MTIICKSWIKYNEKIKLYRNFTYEITKIENDNIYLSCETFNDLMFDVKQIDKKFTMPYSITNHCIQGMTLNEKYCIFDVFEKHVNLRWLYVAITRPKDFENVYFYVGKLNNDKFELNSEILKRKIKNYRLQDDKADRKYKLDEYIDVEWIKKKYDDQKCKCKKCGEVVELSFDNDNCLEIDRLSSNLPHIKSNSQIVCHHCNITKGNRFEDI